LTTELLWELGTDDNDPTLLVATQLGPLFLASPWKLSIGGNHEFQVQPLYYADVDRTTADFACQPFSIAYEETGGKRFQAYDCVCVPKLSWEYGQKVMIEWTIKGKWMDVVAPLGVVPEYVSPGEQPPIIGVNCTVSLTDFFENVNAVSKVTIDTGWAINDVMDTRQAYGFGIAFVALTTYPTIAVEVANFNENIQQDWTDAQANTVFSTNDLIVTLTTAASSMLIPLFTATALTL
jgi:hypothetical protein